MDLKYSEKKVDFLLSVAIPTYNRATYLALSLGRILAQLDDRLALMIEVLVIDNCSVDNTTEIATSKLADRPDVSSRYIRNDENIGLDGNITKAYNESSGKFVLVFGDDDVLIDGSLSYIVEILEAHPESGVVYLESFGFTDNYLEKIPKTFETRYLKCLTPKPFMLLVNYYFTYTSGNIINKRLVNDKISLNRFLGTNLNLLNWIFTAVFAAKYNIYIPARLIASKTENTGGYGFCKIFAINGNFVFDYFKSIGTDPSFFDIINNKMLVTYFPFHHALFRKDNKGYVKENYYKELLGVYKKNIRFWLFCVPPMFLPRDLAKLSLYVNRLFSKGTTFIARHFIFRPYIKKGLILRESKPVFGGNEVEETS